MSAAPPAPSPVAAPNKGSQQDAASSSSSSNSSNPKNISGLLPAVSLFVLAVDALAGTRETAAAALLLGLGKRAKLGSPGEESVWGVHSPRRRQQQQRSPRSPRSPRRAAAAAAAGAAAAAAAETAEGRARLLLCGLLHCRLSQGRLKALQRHLIPVETGETKKRDRNEKPPPRPNPMMTSAEVQAVRPTERDSEAPAALLAPSLLCVPPLLALYMCLSLLFHLVAIPLCLRPVSCTCLCLLVVTKDPLSVSLAMLIASLCHPYLDFVRYLWPPQRQRDVPQRFSSSRCVSSLMYIYGVSLQVFREAGLPLAPSLWQPLLKGDTQPFLQASELFPVGPSPIFGVRGDRPPFVELQHLQDPPPCL